MPAILIRECQDHGTFSGEAGCCPKCAMEIANGRKVLSVMDMMDSSLEALAKRLK